MGAKTAGGIEVGAVGGCGSCHCASARWASTIGAADGAGAGAAGTTEAERRCTTGRCALEAADPSTPIRRTAVWSAAGAVARIIPVVVGGCTIGIAVESTVVEALRIDRRDGAEVRLASTDAASAPKAGHADCAGRDSAVRDGESYGSDGRDSAGRGWVLRDPRDRTPGCVAERAGCAGASGTDRDAVTGSDPS